jgi:hypothetical protein
MCTVIQIDSGEIANFSQKMSHKLEISAKQILSEMKKKSDGKFPIKKIQSADFDRVGRVRGNKLNFNFGLIIIIFIST